MPLDKINIRTEEIDEILGRAPNRIIRWGISIILFVIVVLLTGSWFFKYPDFITSTIEITTQNPPVEIIAKASGKIDAIMIKNNDKVKAGQLLATIDNPTNFDDYLLLKEQLDSFNYNPVDDKMIPAQIISDEKELGELQSSYTLFVSSWMNLLNYLELDFYRKKISAIEKQIDDYNAYYNSTFNQKSTLINDLELAEKDLNRHKELFKNNTIAEAKLEESQSRYLSKKSSYENFRTTLAQIRIEISQLENSILDLRLEDKKQKEKLLISFNEAFENLKAQVDIWEQLYLLQSPVDGTCVFTKHWSSNHNVVTGEKVMTVIPDGEELLLGKLLLPVSGSGKVKKGQKVNIKLHNYPHMEFGMLEGVITSISAVPNEEFYYVDVSFPGGTVTNYGIEIPFSQKMHGSAEIITDDLRVIDRILQPVRSVLRRQ